MIRRTIVFLLATILVAVGLAAQQGGRASSPSTWRADLEAPLLYFVPSIAISGMAF